MIPLSFDRIMFRIPLDCVSIADETKFIGSITSTGNYLSRVYDQKKPYLLWIKFDYYKQEVIINISSKCLNEDYNKLINLTTIKKLITNMNKLNIINVKVEDVLHRSTVLSCDVTMDKEGTLTQQDINLLKVSLKKKCWSAKTEKSSITFTKKRMSLSIYDKYEEIKSKPSRHENPSLLLKQFKDKIRYELKLLSIKGVANHLSTNDSVRMSIFQILCSTQNPIEDVYNSIRTPDMVSDFESNTNLINNIKISKKNRSINHYKNELLCRECDYDTEKVKSLLKVLTSSKTNITSLMKPYREIITSHLIS